MQGGGAEVRRHFDRHDYRLARYRGRRHIRNDSGCSNSLVDRDAESLRIALRVASRAGDLYGEVEDSTGYHPVGGNTRDFSRARIEGQAWGQAAADNAPGCAS